VPLVTLVKLFETVDAVRAVKLEVVPAGHKFSELLAATGGRSTFPAAALSCK